MRCSSTLARRLADTSITVNAAHPGIIGGTGLDREAPGVAALVADRFRFDPADLPGPDTGADTPAWLATSPDVNGITGRFFVDRRVVDTALHTTDPTRTDRLWNESATLVGLPVDLAGDHGR
jgi:NAD(P)-dependent dehydrogenase (short-subunit alcohol dehydrogenase family)